ncbi:helix-turn-helix transcriptional regulator [Nocardia zapadnayensis]|uniref:winged helix-turn-helix transcriptional regulator n=1 Tax=Nocardia rhamnosiphila TaxID=426716 RepID=UPI0022459BED|nr:helix-turn-helix domain-containing protein [Nocardia zapadnayensis]MCX0273317.1 helix-turn-helix transcriptional regulator [Nocardia zapadnayensis]
MCEIAYGVADRGLGAAGGEETAGDHLVEQGGGLGLGIQQCCDSRPMVVKVLAEDSPCPVRFAALRRRMPGVSQKMLSQTLRGLVADGLVTRHVEPTVPPQVHYGLTELGQSLELVLAAMRDWAETHMPAISAHRMAGVGPEDAVVEGHGSGRTDM